MSSTHKTFQTGEILSADDVNNALNSTTADHLPYAMAAGSVSIPKQSGRIWTLELSFPPGRFSKPPIVTATVNTTAGGTDNVIARVDRVTTTSMRFLLLTTDGSNIATGYAVPVGWIAVQMDT